MLKRYLMLPLAAAVAVAGCGDGDDGFTPDTGGLVSVQFRAVTSTGADAAFGASTGAAAAEPITLHGTDGATLEIDGLFMVVDELELEQVDGACAGEAFGGDDDDDEDCSEFEAGPFFVEVPLGPGEALVVSDVVPPGTYEELELEVEDLDLDDGGDDEGQGTAALLAQIRAQFPAWPAEASMMVTGRYTSAAGETREFTTFFEAEVEVELEFDPPLQVPSPDGSTAVTVVLDPARWFVRGDGSVMDLSAFDFGATGSLMEFEAELENGFLDVELDDD